eukprot:gene884-513_t
MNRGGPKAKNKIKDEGHRVEKFNLTLTEGGDKDLMVETQTTRKGTTSVVGAACQKPPQYQYIYIYISKSKRNTLERERGVGKTLEEAAATDIEIPYIQKMKTVPQRLRSQTKKERARRWGEGTGIGIGDTDFDTSPPTLYLYGAGRGSKWSTEGDAERLPLLAPPCREGELGDDWSRDKG